MTTTAPNADQHPALAAARSRALETLRVLEQARADSEQRLTESGQPDHFKRVTGRSALDNAIASARRIIDTLDRHAKGRPNTSPSPVVTTDARVAIKAPARLAGVLR